MIFVGWIGCFMSLLVAGNLPLLAQTYRADVGKIKSIHSKTYRSKENQLETTPTYLVSIKSCYFNKKGLVTIDSFCSYDSSQACSINMYAYDKKERLVEKVNLRSPGNKVKREPSPYWEVFLKEDNKRKQYLEKRFGPSLSMMQTDSFHFGKEKLLRKHAIWLSHGKRQECRSVYTPKKQVEKEEYFDQDGTLSWYILNQFDSKNRIIKNEEWVLGLGLTNSTTYVFDQRSNVIHEQIMDGKGEPLSETYYGFNTENRMSSEVDFTKGIFKKKRDYQYNDHGDLVFEVWQVSQKGKEFSYRINHEYAYDHAGNWTERKSFKNGELCEIIHREIVYD